MQRRILGIEDMIEEINMSVKENVKFENFLTQNIHKSRTLKKIILKEIGFTEDKES